jgi:hypothetical protein
MLTLVLAPLIFIQPSRRLTLQLSLVDSFKDVADAMKTTAININTLEAVKDH